MTKTIRDYADSTLLLVDDDPQNLDILSRLLRPYHKTRAAISGERALQLARTDPRPDLILLDVVMPEMDGFAVLEQLRVSPETRDIPVIFVTGRDSHEDEERGLQMGAVDYITKPYRPSIILARVNTHLELKLSQDRLAGQNVMLEEEVARRTAELAAARDAAEAASRSKSAFINTMSHELRTPMNGIYGILQVLEGELPEDDSMQEYMKVAKESATALIKLLDYILDYSSSIHGELKLQHQPLIPAELLRETVNCFAASAAEKGLRLTHVIDPQAPGEMLGDRLRLQQVLAVLIDNALKFTNTGSVELSLSPGSQQGDLLFSVRDTGIGVESEKQEKMFDVFSQVDDSATRSYGGAGVGLALAKQLVKRMGGTIDVESTPGQGSTFYFSIPNEAPE